MRDASPAIRVEVEREDDGHGLAEVPALSGALADGRTRDAIARVEALALRILAERLERGEPTGQVDDRDWHVGAREGDIRYRPPPRHLRGFPDALPAKPKTPVQGGGGLRPRWKDSKGRIYEWDGRHGTVEVYGKTGRRHLGEFNPVSGR